MSGENCRIKNGASPVDDDLCCKDASLAPKSSARMCVPGKGLIWLIENDVAVVVAVTVAAALVLLVSDATMRSSMSVDEVDPGGET